MSFKLLHLDFSYCPICQWSNQCGLVHNELLIFLIPLPTASEIYQNAITRMPPFLFFSFFLFCLAAHCKRMVHYPGVALVHGELEHGVAKPLNRLWSGSAMYNSIMLLFHGQRTPTVLIQTPPMWQTKHSATSHLYFANLCVNNDRYCDKQAHIKQE